MDVGHLDSEIIETLDFLRPPVKRYCKNLHQDYIGYVISSGDSANRDILHKTKSQRTAKSSLSLILQKTCKKQIFQKYTYTNSNTKSPTVPIPIGETNTTTKPTVKVTVVPKREYLFDLLDPKNKYNKKYEIDSTLTNNENSIAAKNLYLVVAGHKRDKIYEIKTVGSTTIKDKVKDVKILHNKRVSSKMDKKKKKSPTFEIQKEGKAKCSDVNCDCYFPKDNIDKEEYPGSSRVRIVGRIGLNEDDKYVMKCAATVNGQPVVTNYISAKDVMPESTERYEPRRDIKTDKPIRFSLNEDKFTKTANETMTSQATQIDTGMQYTKYCPKSDRTIQCNLCDMCNNTLNNTLNDKSSNLHRSTSPLVVISVYPKPVISVNTETENSSMIKYDTQNYRPVQQKDAIRINNLSLNTDLYNPQDLTPTKPNIARYCPCDTDKKVDIKTNKNKTKTNASLSASPQNRSPNTKLQDRKKILSIDTNLTKPKSRSPSPNRLSKNNKQQRDTKSSNQTKKAVVYTSHRVETIKQQNANPRSKSKSRDKSVNTATVQTPFTLEDNKVTKKVTNIKKKNNKKMLVNNKDDKRLTDGTVLRKTFPKNEISKVSINIDSEREFYDVVFEKGTDFTVRRTAKDNFGLKYFEETFEQNFENDNNERRKSDSLENFFPMVGMGQHRRSASQAFEANENEKAEYSLAQQNMSRLNVRDSLEIGHRRDHPKTQSSKHHFGNDSDEDNKDIPLGSTKHFAGDKCCVRDPIERDKEIRELLGIDTKKMDRRQSDEKIAEICGNNTMFTRCLFHKTLCERLVKTPAVNWACSSCTNQQIANTKKREEEKSTSITDDEKQDLKKLSTIAKIRKRNVTLQARVKVPVLTNQQSTQFDARTAFESDIKTLNNQNEDLNFKLCQNRKVIQLTRNQYRRVKKTIYRVNGSRKMGRPFWNSSIVSLGSVRPKRRSEFIMHWNKEVQTDPLTADLKMPWMKESKSLEDNQNKLIVLFPKKEAKERTEVNKYKIKDDPSNKSKNGEGRRAASSVEIRYASIAYDHKMMQMERSFADVKYYEQNQLKRHDSIETLFRGHKKPRTPNLGPSALSLLTEEKPLSKSSPDLKRKPFLRRLMSCLVMRSQMTQVKLPESRRKPVTMESSVDSYHISTSLGAIEMSSSVYDTTASFYSNHTIGIINKTKRGFLSSVRGFLTSRITDVVVHTSRKI